MLDIALQIRRVAAVGIAAAAILVALYVATQTYRVKVAPAELNAAVAAPSWPKGEATASAARERIINPRGVVRMFDLDGEGNVPAIWSCLQLVAAAGLLFLIARHARIGGDHAWLLWTVLGFGFVFLAIDEGGSIHSSFYLASSDETVRKSRGIFYFSWVIPALIAVAIVGLAYLRFLWNLPTVTRWLFIVAGAWYVASGAGGEMMQGWWAAQGYSKIRLSFAAMTIVEEAGEMLAILLFICALLDYMRRENITVKLHVVGEPEPAVAIVPTRVAPVRHIEPALDEVEEEAEVIVPG